MKRSVWMLTVVLAVLIVLAGCGNAATNGNENQGNVNDANGNGGQANEQKSENGGNDAAPAGGKVTIWATNINVPVLEQAGEMYKEQNPGFELEVVEMNNTDIDAKMSVGLLAGGQGLPDAILNVDDGLSGLFNRFPDAFLNLSEQGFDEYKDQFPAYKWSNVTYEGDAYAFPFDAGPVGVFYRKDLFEQAGVNAADIETWDDFFEAGVKIKEATGVSMLSLDVNEPIIYTILLGQQGKGYFEDDGTIVLGSDESIRALHVLKSMADRNILLATNGWNSWVASLANGETATAIAGAWLIGTLEQQVPDSAGNWGVMALPAFAEGSSRSANQGGSSFTVNARSENAQLAYEFLKYFTTTYEVQELAMKGGLFPTFAPVYDSDLFTAPLEYFGGEAAWAFFAEQIALIPPVSFSVNDAIAREEATKSQQEVILGGTEVEASIAAAKQRAESRIQ